MERQDPQDRFSHLISRYLSGNTDASEQAELEAWVRADPANRARFTADKKAWLLSGLKETRSMNTDAAWRAVDGELFPEATTRALPGRRRWLRVAAAVLVLIVSGALAYRYLQPSPPLFAEATAHPLPVELTDGSRVTLNRAATIRFVTDNERGEREARLTGDAFFDVARDESTPFVVHARDVTIEVLGTSFYVDGRPDEDEVQVIVRSGRVAVRAGGQTVDLQKDERAVFRPETNELRKDTNTDANYLAFQTGELVFKNTPLPEAVSTLNRYYDARITIGAEALYTCRVTSTFKDKSLEAVLIILESTFGIRSERNGNDIVLIGQCERAD